MKKKKKSAFKEWTTRKKTLLFAIAAVLIYAVSDIVLTFVYANTGSAMYFDSTLTTEFFEFMKLISGLGGSLTAAEILSETVKSVAAAKKKEEKEKVEEPVEVDDDFEDLG